ncbi:MAG: thiamine diphosphokinase [Ruminococcaceae bacterium]|nr:thiamine diphosphokinase [Oscillospiraceae bacterium]
MRAFLYVGGEIRPENITEKPSDGDLIIAADSGLLNARKMGVKPTVLLGDFDSLGEPLPDETAELIRLPAEKDETDTQAAVELAVSRGATEIFLIGGLSGRLDHTLSVLAVLENLNARHIHALVTNGQNRVRFLRDNSTLIARSKFRYLSLIAADPVVKGVTLEGCKYPLKKARLLRQNQYAVSNELTGNCALIDVRRGGVWILETVD